MFPYTTALAIIEQLQLTGERAWIGDTAPDGVRFEACDLYRQPGFRPAIQHVGRYESVWAIQDVLSIQGWRILLDSCVRMLGERGTLVVRYLQNQHISIPALKSFLFRKYGIRVQVGAEIIGNGEFVTAFQIERKNLSEYQNKNWTFGVLTQGKKPELIERFCRSVREFGGYSHEILIIGPRNALYDPYQPTYIDKTYSSMFSDICVKKNDIVAQACHDNICILHDRYVLNKDFFAGFEEYGYDFDFLTIRQHHASGKIYPSYCAMDDGAGLIWGPIYECGNENETWKQHYLNGGLIIAKRGLLRTVPFNDLIFHNQAEDVELAKVLENHSVVPRINRLSSAVTDVPDHLTNAFVHAAHPWETRQTPEIRPTADPVQAPVPAPAPAPILVADPGAVPWRRLKGIRRRVDNLRREGATWSSVAHKAGRFVHRRLSRRLHGSALATTYVTMSATGSAAAPKQRPHDSEGCNILLYANTSDGVFNLTVHYMRRLQREGIPFCIVAIDYAVKRNVLPEDLQSSLAPAPIYPRNIWCLGFPFINHHLHVHSAWAADRWNVNFTHWELPYVPQRLTGNFERLDGLMTTTAFVRDALAGVTDLPIEVVDPEVRIDAAVVAKFDRKYFGLPADKRLFLLNWEFTSSTIRKNPAAGVRAFEEAFAGMQDDVALVMHVKISSEKDAKIHAEYQEFLASIKSEHPHVIVIDRTSFSYDEALGLKGACDCYVSLHRSEGYGMGCAEALALGRYCLMTGWSGNMELLKKPEWTARIATVDVALIPVAPEDFPWVDANDEVFQLWADPRPGDAANKMRRIYTLMIENESVAVNAV